MQNFSLFCIRNMQVSDSEQNTNVVQVCKLWCKKKKEKSE